MIHNYLLNNQLNGKRNKKFLAVFVLLICS